MNNAVPRLLFAGGSSGSGKTTVSCAFLAALKSRGMNPAAFKCGPDFIDPMFHTTALGVPCRNLDIFLCGEATVRNLLAEHGRGRDIALIEGVMGLYDGMGQNQHCSSNHIAELTETPTILVVNCNGQSLSVAAQVYGMLHFRPNTIKGVIFNRIPEKMYGFYKKMLEDELGLPCFGFLPKLPDADISSRHLGLVTPAEIRDIHSKIEVLGQAAEAHLDLDGLLALSRSAPLLDTSDDMFLEDCAQPNVTIAVARDKAFCFYYEDSLDVLRRMGAHLEFFSPLEQECLPIGISGLILGGGYPEEHAAMLSANVAMRQSIRNAVHKGMPVFAECGGFMYLCNSLEDREGIVHPMLGLIDADARMTTSLKRFGYITLTAETDGAFCKKGQTFNAHEFHYSDSSDNGQSFKAVKPSGMSWQCIHTQGQIFAGYPHIHLRGALELAQAFVTRCAAYKQENGL